MKNYKDKIRRILLIRPDLIGDVVLLTPAIAAIRENFPNAFISILMQEYTAPLLKRDPNINEILICKIKTKKKMGALNFIKYIFEIRRNKFDLAIDFYGRDDRFPLLLFLAGIKYRVGDKSRLLIGLLYNLGRIMRYRDHTKHMVDLNLELIKSIGVSIWKPELKLYILNSDNMAVAEKLNAFGIFNNDYLVGIHPGCTNSVAWNEEGFAKIIDYLYEKLNAKVILTGGVKERLKGEKIISICKNKPVNLIGSTSIPELMALISKLNLYIGVDTGPTHIGAAFKIPTVLIITAKGVKPFRWSPFNTQNIILYYQRNANCNFKCLPFKCSDPICTKYITSEMVIDAINRIRLGETMTLKDHRILSYNTLILFDQNNKNNARKIHENLSRINCHSILHPVEKIKKPKDIYSIIEQENILIIHHLGKKALFKIWFANLRSIKHTSNTTVLVRGFDETKDIIEQYDNACRSSLY